MEGTRRYSGSPATDSSLLPLNNAPGPRPQSSAPGETSPFRQSRGSDVPQEADLGEPDTSFDEKPGPGGMSPGLHVRVEGGIRAGAPVVVEKRRTVGQRLQTTFDVATLEHKKYEEKAKLAGMAINGAMFAQIISNALITGLSAATSNRQAQIGVSALGALGTIISAFLVRVRGTREPERSVTHTQNLERFLRELDAFMLDEGHSREPQWDAEVKRFRTEFDRLQTAVHQSENGQPMSGTGAVVAPGAGAGTGMGAGKGEGAPPAGPRL